VSTPLAGLKVVEIGQVFAGPYAGAILADLGAEVIKVEKPEGGDDARQMGRAFRHGDALNFVEFNRGKRSVALDLKSPEGVAALHALLEHADILVHNMRPGVPEALGLGAAEVTARHPRLIYCAMAAFGHVGPMRDHPGYEPLLQAFGGLSSITGEPAGSRCAWAHRSWTRARGCGPSSARSPPLIQRARTGRGCVVNTSLLETAMAWGNQKISAFVNQGEQPVRHASGHPGFVPYEAFDASDAPLLVCCGNDRLFRKFAEVLGHPDWPADPRFATNRARLENQDALLPLIRAEMAKRPRARNGWGGWSRPACPARRSTPSRSCWRSRRPRPSACSSRRPARIIGSSPRRSASMARGRRRAPARRGSMPIAGRGSGSERLRRADLRPQPRIGAEESSGIRMARRAGIVPPLPDFARQRGQVARGDGARIGLALPLRQRDGGGDHAGGQRLVGRQRGQDLVQQHLSRGGQQVGDVGLLQHHAMSRTC
jgi:formyl-CoA transferase